jgi:DNA-binding transcriptional regulator YdaS (Cro superfamily)
VTRNAATQADLIAILRSACERAGGQRAWAEAHGLSPQYVCDVLKGRRDVSERMANELGFLREVRFVPFAIRRVA